MDWGTSVPRTHRFSVGIAQWWRRAWGTMLRVPLLHQTSTHTRWHSLTSSHGYSGISSFHALGSAHRRASWCMVCRALGRPLWQPPSGSLYLGIILQKQIGLTSHHPFDRHSTDNFRTEGGHIYKPAIFDDGNLGAVSSADIKGYIDTSMQWARWGGCLFAANQLRIICDNPINWDADREDLEFFATNVPHTAFRKLTRPAYNAMMNDEDFLAILRRCVYMVFGPHRAYIRLPGAVPLPVTIVRLSMGQVLWT